MQGYLMTNWKVEYKDNIPSVAGEKPTTSPFWFNPDTGVYIPIRIPVFIEYRNH